MSKLEMYRGNTEFFDVEAKAADGSALNLSGGELLFTAKSSTRQEDISAPIRKSSVTDGGISITNAVGGLATVTVDPEDTEDLYAPAELAWDLEFVNPIGHRRTLAYGQLLIRPDATRRASGYA